MPLPTFHNLPDEKRRRVIDAAVEEFAAQPYARATLDRIAAAAGVPKGSLYQYFGGKADLYRWLLTEHLPARKLATITASQPGDDASIWEVFEQSFLAGVRFTIAEPELARLGGRFVREPALEPELAAIAETHQQASREWLHALLERGQRQGEVRADLPLDVAAGLLMTMSADLPRMLAARMGMSLPDFLDRPEAVASLTDEDLRELVRDILAVLRHGVGTEGGGRS